MLSDRQFRVIKSPQYDEVAYKLRDQDDNVHGEINVASNDGGTTRYPADPRFERRGYTYGSEAAVPPNEAWVNKFTEPNGQIPLFDHRSTGGERTLIGMFGTKAVRTQMMALAGAVLKDVNHSGYRLLPSSDLSPHSSNLVKKAKNLGVVDASARDTVSNSIGFFPEPWQSKHGYDEVEMPDALKDGMRVVKDVLRANRKPVDRSEQQRLFWD